MTRKAALLLCFMVFACMANAQSDLLKKQRDVLQRQLLALNKHLGQIDKKLHASAEQRNVLQRQIVAKKDGITRLERQMNEVEGNIRHTNDDLSALYSRLQLLKKYYAASLVLSWKLMNEYEVLPASYAAEGKEQQRLQYLTALRNMQLQQAAGIRRLQQQYNDRRQQLGATKNNVSAQVQTQVNAAAQLYNQQQSLTAGEQKLKDQKSKWQLMMKEKEALQHNIENRLRALAAAPAVKPGGKSPVAVTPEPMVAKGANAFRLNKGRLSCPVNGNIYMRFGKQRVNGEIIDVDNQFLTFRTAIDAPVNAVFNGEVVTVASEEDTYIVMIRHGDIFTVYGNLSSAGVTKGQTVTTGTIIGKTATGFETQKGELEFGIYESGKLVDPGSWIICR